MEYSPIWHILLAQRFSSFCTETLGRFKQTNISVSIIGTSWLGIAKNWMSKYPNQLLGLSLSLFLFPSQYLFLTWTAPSLVHGLGFMNNSHSICILRRPDTLKASNALNSLGVPGVKQEVDYGAEARPQLGIAMPSLVKNHGDRKSVRGQSRKRSMNRKLRL